MDLFVVSQFVSLALIAAIMLYCNVVAYCYVIKKNKSLLLYLYLYINILIVYWLSAAINIGGLYILSRVITDDIRHIIIPMDQFLIIMMTSSIVIGLAPPIFIS